MHVRSKPLIWMSYSFTPKTFRFSQSSCYPKYPQGFVTQCDVKEVHGRRSISQRSSINMVHGTEIDPNMSRHCPWRWSTRGLLLTDNLHPCFTPKRDPIHPYQVHTIHRVHTQKTKKRGSQKKGSRNKKNPKFDPPQKSDFFHPIICNVKKHRLKKNALSLPRPPFFWH